MTDEATIARRNWNRDARALLRLFIEDRKGTPFTLDEFRTFAMKGGLSDHPLHGGWGGFWARAIRDKVLTRTQSSRRGESGHAITVCIGSAVV